jgi:adenylate cyclase class 2
VKYVEVELKYALPDPSALKAKLEALGAVAGPESHQVDVYYNPPHKNFLEHGPHQITEWLRIRTDKERGGSFNYKLWHPVDAFPKTHATEYESTVGDVEAVRLALEALGFTPIVTVDKRREAWMVDDIEVAFDTVENLGQFVEFEYKGDAVDEVAATARLKEFIASLEVQLGEQSYGYPHMLL